MTGWTCSELTKAISRQHTFSRQWALPSYIEMTLDMVSAGATFPGNPHLTSHYQNSRGGMFIMAKGGCCFWSWREGGSVVQQQIALSCFMTVRNLQVLAAKHLQVAHEKWCSVAETAYRGTSTTPVNKAQNAQIQVNSHVVFTVHCHCLHDSGENPHRTQHKGRTGPRRALQTLHAKPIVCLCYLSLSFVLVLSFSFPLGVRGKRI